MSPNVKHQFNSKSLPKLLKHYIH